MTKLHIERPLFIIVVLTIILVLVTVAAAAVTAAAVVEAPPPQKVEQRWNFDTLYEILLDTRNSQTKGDGCCGYLLVNEVLACPLRLDRASCRWMIILSLLQGRIILISLFLCVKLGFFFTTMQNLAVA